MGVITASEFARKHGLSVQTVCWYIRNHCHLTPIAKYGNAVLFDEAELFACLSDEMKFRGRKFKRGMDGGLI